MIYKYKFMRVYIGLLKKEVVPNAKRKKSKSKSKSKLQFTLA